MDNGTEISSGISQEPPETLNELLSGTSAQGVLPDHLLWILLYIMIASAAITYLWRMSALVSKQRREIHRLDSEISSLRGEVRKPTKSSFIWRIPNISNELRVGQPGQKNILVSEPFFTSTYGYKLRAHLDLGVHLDETDRHLSASIEVLPGEFDSILRWSFVMKGSVALMDQAENPYEALHWEYKYYPIAWPCERPLEGSTSCAMEFPRFIYHDHFFTRHYIKDDTIFITIEIEEIEKLPSPFEDDDPQQNDGPPPFFLLDYRKIIENRS